MAEQLPSLESVATINADGSRKFVHPADVHGRFSRLRAWTGWLLILIYAALPWIPVNGNPAVFLDFASRQVHLFGLTFVPQDFWLAFFLVTGLGFSLFYITAVVGRVWCGWTCPQTVFIELVFRPIECLIEGRAPQRRLLDASPWTPTKIARRTTKWTLYAILSVAIAHIFVSYFISIPELYAIMHRSPLENWGLFTFVFLLSAVIFFDFTWFREQFCIVLCPYGRLQSVLLDNDSVVIGYDRKRGEPRGKLLAAGAGDCIDCHRCVQVCPTGIDIRQGLQIECIACANCIDACDEIMTKVGRPRGLVRYDSTNGLEGQKTRYIRPRTILYTILLGIGTVVMLLSLSTLGTATATVLRMPGFPYFMYEGKIRNQYLLRIENKRNQPVHFNVQLATDLPGITISGAENGIDVPALGQQSRPIVVIIPATSYHGTFTAEFVVSTSDFHAVKSAPFLGPDVDMNLGQ